MTIMKSLLKDELDQMWETFDYKWFVSNDPIQMLHKIQRVPDSSICLLYTSDAADE